jgi:hypothetical protein
MVCCRCGAGTWERKRRGDCVRCCEACCAGRIAPDHRKGAVCHDGRANELAAARITQFAEILEKSSIPDDKLYLGAYWFFERLKLFAVFTKHRGFKEENEWRVVYMRDRDRDKVFDRRFSYWIGPRGVEPKLKVKIERTPDPTDDDLSLSKIVERIILGPSLSSPLARASIHKMLDTLGRSDLKDRIKSSTIPFRAG